MSIFPFINGDDGILETSTNTLPIYYEVAWDFVNDRAIFQDGNPKIVEKNEAIKVWVYKAIKTARYEHEIYSFNYGCEIGNLIGKGYVRGFIESEAIRYIEEALLINPYIKRINNLKVSIKDDKLFVDGNIETIYGNLIYKI